ncbi:MAG: hypothetical protein ABIN83_04395 [Sphingomicrobium sp.]
MKNLYLIAGVCVLAACGREQAAGPAAEETNVAANTAEAPATAMSLNETTWTYTRKGQQIQESIDANGDYIANAGTKHLDHGKYAMVDGKHCFTSAMTKEGQVCWTTPANTEVGASADITSDKGEKLTVTRQAYVAMSM